ncbi:glycosyl transferase [Methylophilaceae bacterium]|nr:glycosyl transferase [Methylophilaceae bacterium]
MRFDLEHDWQGNMATPRKNLGEKTKIQLFLILTVIWIFTGLTGHGSWQSIESDTISQILDIIQKNEFIAPLASSNTSLTNPPLYSFVAAGFAKMFTFILPVHDGARLSNALWVSITLISIGLATRELWGIGFGRQAGLLFIASIGLILNIHSLIPDIATLTGLSLCFYSLTLYYRRPFRSSILMGSGLGISFLSGGLVPLISIVVTSIILYAFIFWRNNRYLTFIGLSFGIGIVIISPWVISMNYLHPQLFSNWLNQQIFISSPTFLYTLSGVSWFTWPSLPLVIFTLFQGYKNILKQKRLLLPLVFILVYFVVISYSNKQDQMSLMPFLIPFCIISVGSIDTLKRGSASALNLFGILIFGFIGILIWLGWLAMQTGMPSKIFERMFYLSGNFNASFEIIPFIICLIFTSYWALSIFKQRITNRTAISNWAIGITMIWLCLVMLWGPFIDNRKSYKLIFNEVKQHLVQSTSCLYLHNLSENQKNLLHYYTGVKGDNNPTNQGCYLALISLREEAEFPSEYREWEEIWTGKILRGKNYFILVRKDF